MPSSGKNNLSVAAVISCHRKLLKGRERLFHGPGPNIIVLLQRLLFNYYMVTVCSILYIYSIYVFYERKLINLREVCLIVRGHVKYYSANYIICTI